MLFKNIQSCVICQMKAIEVFLMMAESLPLKHVIYIYITVYISKVKCCIFSKNAQDFAEDLGVKLEVYDPIVRTSEVNTPT